MKCTSCGKSIESESGWVELKCPKCGKETILRCNLCKKLANQYACASCKFVGP